MRSFVLIIFILVGYFGYSQTLNLRIQIENIEDINGILNIGIFNHENTFPIEGKEFRTVVAKVNKSTETVLIKDLPKGEYAISIFNDENLDDKCNTNFLGLPKEDYGFSNNFRPRFSAPKFDDCKLKFVNDTTIIIELH